MGAQPVLCLSHWIKLPLMFTPSRSHSPGWEGATCCGFPPGSCHYLLLSQPQPRLAPKGAGPPKACRVLSPLFFLIITEHLIWASLVAGGTKASQACLFTFEEVTGGQIDRLEKERKFTEKWSNGRLWGFPLPDYLQWSL